VKLKTQLSAVLLFVASLHFSDLHAAELSARAVVRAEHRATLSSQQAGVISEFPIEERAEFSEGDVLARLHCRLQQAQMNSAQAELEASQLRKRNFERLSELASSSALELELSRLEVKLSQARLEAAVEMVDRCTVTAPFDGVLANRLVNAYENVDANQPILEIVGNDQLELVIIAPQEWLGFVTVGFGFEFQSESGALRAKGELLGLPVIVDTASQTIELIGQISDADSRLLPGMTGTVVLHHE